MIPYFCVWIHLAMHVMCSFQPFVRVEEHYVGTILAYNAYCNLRARVCSFSAKCVVRWQSHVLKVFFSLAWVHLLWLEWLEGINVTFHEIKAVTRKRTMLPKIPTQDPQEFRDLLPHLSPPHTHSERPFQMGSSLLWSGYQNLDYFYHVACTMQVSPMFQVFGAVDVFYES